jgi:hypothetical protein
MLRRLTDRLRPRRGDTAALEETFSSIYAEGTWTDKLPGMPPSGRGALPERSQSVIGFIKERIASGEVRSIADVGCGDLAWVSTVPEITSGEVTYLGYDVVPSLLAEHRGLGWGEFRFGDVTAKRFRVHADLVLVKDVLIHLTDEQVERALANLRASQWKWLLTSSSPEESNEDRTCNRWHFAPLNLLAAPYHLRPTHHLERPDGGSFVVFDPAGFASEP